MRDDDTDIEALPASVSFRFVSFRVGLDCALSTCCAFMNLSLLMSYYHNNIRLRQYKHGPVINILAILVDVPTNISV